MPHNLLDLEKLNGRVNTPDSLGGIVLGNFRCFAERSYVPLAPITLIFGENSSGKSTLLHAINFISRSLEAFSVDVNIRKEEESLPHSVKSFLGWSVPSLEASFSHLPDGTQERHVDKLDLDYISKVFGVDQNDPQPLLSKFTEKSGYYGHILTLGADYGKHAVVIDWEALHLPERVKSFDPENSMLNISQHDLQKLRDENPLNQKLGPFWPSRIEEYFHFEQPIELSNPLIWELGNVNDYEDLQDRISSYESQKRGAHEDYGKYGEETLGIYLDELDNPDFDSDNDQRFDFSSMVFLRLDACVDWLKRLEVLYKREHSFIRADHSEKEKRYAELNELSDDCFALLDKWEDDDDAHPRQCLDKDENHNLSVLSQLGMDSYPFFPLDEDDTFADYYSGIDSFWADDPRENPKGFVHHAHQKNNSYSPQFSYDLDKKDIQAFGFVFKYVDHVNIKLPKLYVPSREELEDMSEGRREMYEAMPQGQVEPDTCGWFLDPSTKQQSPIKAIVDSNNWQQSGREVDMLRDFISVCVSKLILDNRESFPILIDCKGHPQLQNLPTGNYKREPRGSDSSMSSGPTLIDAVTSKPHNNLFDLDIATGNGEPEDAPNETKDTCSGPPYNYQCPWNEATDCWISEFSAYDSDSEKLRIGSFLFQDDIVMGDKDTSLLNPFHVPFLRLILAASELTVLVAAYQRYFQDKLSERELRERGEFHKLFREDLCKWHENAKFCFVNIPTEPPIENRPEFQFLCSQEEVSIEYTRGLAREIESILALLDLKVDDLIPLLDIQCAFKSPIQSSKMKRNEIAEKRRRGIPVSVLPPVRQSIQITSIFRPSALDRIVESVINSPLPSDQDCKCFVGEVLGQTSGNFNAHKLEIHTYIPNTIEPCFSFVMKNPGIGVELLRAAAKGEELGQMTSLIFAWICAGKEEKHYPWTKYGDSPIAKCDPILNRHRFGNYGSMPTQELSAQRGGPQDYFLCDGVDSPQKDVIRKLSSLQNCELVNDWFKRLGIDYKVEYDTTTLSNRKIEALSFFDLRSDPDCEHSISYSDLGFGISQILPVILNCVCQKNQIMTMDEPEASVHPRLQAVLGSLFLDARSKGNQVIAATHSEYLVLRMLRHVRTGKLDPNDLCVLYVSRGEGGSTVQRLRVDDRGEFIDTWPGGFFDDRLDELLGDEID